jgi:hypothetical protein
MRPRQPDLLTPADAYDRPAHERRGMRADCVHVAKHSRRVARAGLVLFDLSAGSGGPRLPRAIVDLVRDLPCLAFGVEVSNATDDKPRWLVFGAVVVADGE